MTKAGAKGYVIAGVGVGSPGRFISTEQYRKTYGRQTIVNRDIAKQVGNPKVGSNSETLVIAERSAENLEKDSGDFDGVMLCSVLQRMTPNGVEVAVCNDAAAQLKGIVACIDDSSLINNKAVLYCGPGTGFGAAVMKNGELVTDGHYQYIRLEKRNDANTANHAMDNRVFDLIADWRKDEYNKVEYSKGAVMPEDMLSGSGINYILQKVLEFPDMQKEELEGKLDEIYADSGSAKAIKMREACRSIGRYFGDMLAMLHKGDFTHMDARCEWPLAD